MVHRCEGEGGPTHILDSPTNPHIPPRKLARQHRHQMIGRSLRRRIAHHVNIRGIMQTRDTTRHHNDSSSVVLAPAPICHDKLACCGEEIEKSDGEEVVCHGVDLEGFRRVRVGGRPERGPELVKGCIQDVAGYRGIAADPGVGDEDIEATFV